MKLKDTSWKESYDQPRQHIKKQRYYFAMKGPSSQGYGFSSSNVWMIRVGLWRKLSPEELMLLNCGVEDSWESLGQQGDPTSPSSRRSVLGVHWKNWCLSWKSNTMATWCEELTLIWKDPDAGKDWGQKGTTEDEMVGWHQWLNGQGFGWTLGVGDGQEGLASCCSWGCKETDMTERLNWTEMASILDLSW